MVPFNLPWRNFKIIFHLYIALRNKLFQPLRRTDALAFFSDFKSRVQTFLCPRSIAHCSFPCYDFSPMDLNGATLSFLFLLSVTADILLNGAWTTLYVYIEHSSTCAVICNTNQKSLEEKELLVVGRCLFGFEDA